FDAPFFRDSALNRHGKFPIRLNQQLDIIPLDFIWLGGLYHLFDKMSHYQYNTNKCSYSGGINLLSDLERKLLRILYNYSTQRHHMPTMVELEIKTGRSKQDIYAGLRVLVEQRYIFWPDNPHLDTLSLRHGIGTSHNSILKSRPQQPAAISITGRVF
ncbi:hypothetical protein RW092_12430, partial [Paenibacillus sp. 3LSP]|nr:hypothetical protein [Paenibacillus sp. 3LSP]